MLPCIGRAIDSHSRSRVERRSIEEKAIHNSVLESNLDRLPPARTLVQCPKQSTLLSADKEGVFPGGQRKEPAG